MSAMTLLPCPFCGPGRSMVDTCFDDVAHRWRVYCGRCGCSTGIHPKDKTKAPAIAAWNRRASITQPAQSVDVEKVREVISELSQRGNTGFNTNERARCNHWADKLIAALQPKETKA